MAELTLPELTFYRMPDFRPTGTLNYSLKEAICNSLRSTTDYRGITLPSTHIWTEVSHSSNTAATFYSPLNENDARCAITFLGADSAVAPTMLTPDTFSTNNLLLGLTKKLNSQTPSDVNYLTNPIGDTFSGYSAVTPTAAKSIITRCRAYISQEAIFINIFTDFSTPFWAYLGAIIEPLKKFNTTKHDYVPAAEADDRVYGITTSGTTTVNAAFMSTSPTLFVHSTTAFANHSNIFQPNSSTVLNNIRRRLVTTGQYENNENRDISNNYVFDSFEILRNSVFRIGNSRGIFTFGGTPKAAQFIIREGSVDKYHIISKDQGVGATQSLVLIAAP